MRKIMKARKGGFTLVELLIVIIIIAILAGMMLLTTGAATDGAEASKLVNNLRSLKSAALLYYIDHNQTWVGVGSYVGNNSTLVVSLSPYMDRSIDAERYGPIEVADGTGNNVSRRYIGFTATGVFTDKPGVQAKLAGMARESGLFDSTFTPYSGFGVVYMNLR